VQKAKIQKKSPVFKARLYVLRACVVVLVRVRHCDDCEDAGYEGAGEGIRDTRFYIMFYKLLNDMTCYEWKCEVQNELVNNIVVGTVVVVRRR